MATVLHINSSVRNEGSISRQLTGEFIDKWQASNPNDKIIERDLAANPVPHLTEQMMGAFFTPADQRTTEQAQVVNVSDDLVAELLAADVIVIGAPMYNFSVPSQLKAWIDRIAVAGQTFRYTEAGPEGLCGGKKLIIVSTAGGLHAGQASNVGHEDYLKLVFGFLGITDIEFVRAQGLAYGDEVRNKSLSDANVVINEQLFAAA